MAENLDLNHSLSANFDRDLGQGLDAEVEALESRDVITNLLNKLIDVEFDLGDGWDEIARRNAYGTCLGP